MSDVNDTINAEKVRQAELELILGRKPGPQDTDPSIWGVALSGGGIRSATFSLGVLQVLARHRLLRGFHYLSTVSGGGYVGACLQALIFREGFSGAFKVLKSSIREQVKATPGVSASDDDPQKPIRHLREYSNFLSPRKTALSGDTLGMLGTYVRNVLLIQIQLCNLLIALSLLPLLLYPWVEQMAAWQPVAFLVAAGVSGVCAVTLLGRVTKSARREQSKPERAKPERSEPDRGAGVVNARGLPKEGVTTEAVATIWVLALAAVLAAIGFWGINHELGHSASSGVVFANRRTLPSTFDQVLFWVTSVLYFLAWMLWLLCGGLREQSGQKKGSDSEARTVAQRVLRYVWATAAASVLAGFSLAVLRHVFSNWQGEAGLWSAMIVGPICVLAAVELTAIVHLGLAGWALSDLQREVWARVGGKTAGLVVVGVGGALTVTTYGPWLLTCSVSLAEGKWLATGWIGGIAWVLTTGSGVLAAYSQRAGDPRARTRWLDRIARVAPWAFLLGLLVTISSAAQYLLSLAGWSVWPCAKGDDSMTSYLGHLSAEAVSHNGLVLAAVFIAAAIWILFGFAMDINEFSMNAFYRNRLVRCYLGASNRKRAPEPITNFDPEDDIVLTDVVKTRRDHGTRPLFPLIGATLNLLAIEQLDWQDRKAASFCLTPGYCGYIPPPSHPGARPVGDARAAIAGTEGTSDVGPAATTIGTGRNVSATTNRPVAATMTLGDAMAISGAAVSPNMGYHSSMAATFLLTMFDARLGWWLLNPVQTKLKRGVKPTFFGLWLIKEMLGITRETGRYIYLSDGGHFENLGIYELVRRGARFILAVDASADPDREFADLGNAIQKCRTDFGVEITIDVGACRCDKSGISARSCAVGTIKYPGEKPIGTLLYIKPALTGREPADVAYYARANPTFPHESTVDQFFDEAQFESYRRLGEFMADSALQPVLERAKASSPLRRHHRLDVRDSEFKDGILIELQHRWSAASMDAMRQSSTHKDSMTTLFSELRENPALSVLDAQIYPAWADIASSTTDASERDSVTARAPKATLPRNENFRACFYFCQELAQLMESVYDDLVLEKCWNHIDNRGWMNAFRHWSWSPMFRVAWAVGSPTYGRSFVSFCELRLDLPRLTDIVEVVEKALPQDTEWTHHCDALRANGEINLIERDILVSAPIISGQAPEKLRLYLLRMKWHAVLKREKGEAPYTTVGMAVLDGQTVVTFRIQDHLRRMGLGARFMHLLVSQCEIDTARIKAGDYGAVGKCGDGEASRAEKHINALLVSASMHAHALSEADKARRRSGNS